LQGPHLFLLLAEAAAGLLHRHVLQVAALPHVRAQQLPVVSAAAL
jgi:hypothetical protein